MIQTLLYNFLNPWILDLEFQIIQSNIYIPICFRIDLKLLHSGRHIQHDHTSGIYINLVWIIWIVLWTLSVFGRNKLRILSNSIRPRHCPIEVIIYLNWLKVRQFKLSIIIEQNSSRINAPMHRLWWMESMQHKHNSCVHSQKFSLRPTIAFFSSILALLFEVVT